MFQQSRLAEAVMRAQQHWDEQHRRGGKKEDTAWTIAISREAGANGSRIAKEVGARLDWHVYDHELVEHIARDHGLRVKLLDTIDEKSASWLREAIEQFSTAAEVSTPAYVRYLVETLRSLSEHGHCVIVGRGAAQMLPPEKTLRVRLIGALHDRVHSVVERFGVSQAEARAWIEKIDRERRRFAMDHFHKDPNEAHHYDLTINSGRFSVEECAELIVKALEEVKKVKTPEAVHA